MFAPATPLAPLNRVLPTAAFPALCPFHDGAATLDLLLAELDPAETTVFDAVLDLRSVFAARRDASECVDQLFRVRQLLAGRHYLAFYRVRCWARQALRVEVSAGRDAPWIVSAFPLDAARRDEVVNSSLADQAQDGVIPVNARVRFAFAVPLAAEHAFVAPGNSHTATTDWSGSFRG